MRSYPSGPCAPRTGIRPSFTLGTGLRRTMRLSLDVVTGILTDDEADHYTFSWEQLRYQHTAALCAVLQEQYAPATAIKILSALGGAAGRVVAPSAYGLGRLPSSPRRQGDQAECAEGGTAHRPARAARALRRMRCDPGVGGGGDGEILATLYGGGLRRAEVVALGLKDVTLDGTVVIRAAQGNKSRLVPLEPALRRRSGRGDTSAGASRGRAYFPGLKGGRLVVRSLTPPRLPATFAT